MRTVTLSAVFGVSRVRSSRARSLSRRAYLSAAASASAQVDESGDTGPDAIMSTGSPTISLNMTANTCAGAQCCANRPPFTAERRLRIVLISTISAPQARSCAVMSCNSPPGTSGLSNRALPPPERRKSTVSSAVRVSVSASASRVAENEFPSGTGWPASRQMRPGMGLST